MIPRYSRPEMARIWEPEAKFRIWLKIETYAAEAMAELGQIPKHAADAVKKRGGFDIARIDEIEREVKHDVIAFLTSVAEHVGPEARFLHAGLTSSDVLDTCFNVQLVEAADILIADVDALLAALKARAFEHKNTPTIGRSHGVHAEPTTFGLKLAGHYAEFARGRERLLRAREEVAVVHHLGRGRHLRQPGPQRRAGGGPSRSLGLRREVVPTQVVARDCHAAFFLSPLARLGTAVERLATEIRHLQRTEVLEAEEAFGRARKALRRCLTSRTRSPPRTSAAWPARAWHVSPAMENVALWHERDISHSSVERVIGPDATSRSISPSPASPA